MGVRKSPSYLIRYGTVYHFRLMVPKNYRGIVGREVKLSLGTGSLKEARPKASILAGATIEYLENNIHRNQAVATTKAEIKEKLNQYLRKRLDYHEDNRLNSGKDFTKDVTDRKPEIIKIQQQIQHALASGNQKFGRDNTKAFLKQYDLNEINEDSPQFKFAHRELLKLYAHLIEIEKYRVEGDYISEHKILNAYPPPNVAASPVSKPVKRKPKGKKLSKLIQQFIKENVSDNKWSDKTATEHTNRLNALLEVMGDCHVSTIDFKRTRRFFDDLKKLPANRNKTKEYRDKTVADLLKMRLPPEKCMSATTVNNIMQSVSSLFNWAVKRDMIQKNYASGMKVKILERDDEQKEIFSDDQLSQIVKGLKSETDHKHWIPIVSLYSGARLEEISQLLVTDIRQIDGIWAIDINREADKILKNNNAKRIVPIHKALIDKGFVDYVKRTKSDGHQRLFPALKKIKGKYGHSISKWFSSYLKRIGIKIDGRKVSFHSLRHTFINRAKQLDLPEGYVKEIVGHERGSITYGHYGKTYGCIKLKEVIDQVIFDID